MFGVARDAVPTSWATKGQEKADYVEALYYQDDTKAEVHNFRTGHLEDAQILQWLMQSGPYALPTQSPEGKKLIGGLRLLICERQQYSPLDFPLQKETFETVEKVFNLPASTLTTFDSDAGSYTRNLVFEDAARTKLKRIMIIAKAPQKREISNHGIAMSYDVSTRFTSGLLYGFDVPSFEKSNLATALSAAGDPRITVREAQIKAQWNASRDHYHGSLPPESDEPQYIIGPEGEQEEHDKHELIRMIEEAVPAWTHPLLLPSLLLSDHLRRTKHFCNRGRIMQETWAIEGELGVTYVGRKLEKDNTHAYSSHNGPVGILPFYKKASNKSYGREVVSHGRGYIERGQAEQLTVRINTQSLRILFTARSPKWNQDCSTAMHDLLDELHKLIPTHLDHYAQDSLRELLEYNMSMGEAVGSHVASMKERMALQLDVLYSMVAQMDNRLSARLAASAGRDSTSMKILAFITALYLPGSFVSGMFSMGIFQWPHDGDSSNGQSGGGVGSDVVSSDFWVYWATTIPLTAVTLIGWGVWWIFEMRQFKKSYSEALGGLDDPVDKVIRIAEGSRRSFRNNKE